MRNQLSATKQAAKNKQMRRVQTIELIRREVFTIRCVCSNECCKKGDFSNICISNKGLAKLLNEKNIPTLAGKNGKWSTAQVSRLFPRSIPSKTATVVNGSTTLNGLI